MREIREIKFSMEAVFDIADAQDWITLRFGSKECERYEEQLKDFIWNKLRISAGVIGGTKVYYRGYEIYKVPFKVSNIFYFIRDDILYIIRILRQEQLWEKWIGQDEEFTFL